MKIIIILLTSFILSSFSETKITYSGSDMKIVQDNLQRIYEYIDKSNLPHQDVLAIEKSIQDSYQILVKGKIDSISHK